MAVFRNKVWVCCPKDVADVAAWNSLHAPTTHPDPEGKLQVFTTPANHPVVISTNIKEKLPVDTKEAPCHGWCRYWITDLLVGESILVGLPREKT